MKRILIVTGAAIYPETPGVRSGPTVHSQRFCLQSMCPSEKRLVQYSGPQNALGPLDSQTLDEIP